MRNTRFFCLHTPFQTLFSSSLIQKGSLRESSEKAKFALPRSIDYVEDHLEFLKMIAMSFI